jgi:hypothetical protein
MYELHGTRPLRTNRPREQFLDIARSWRKPVRAILKDGEFIGYFCGDLNELTLTDMAYFNDVIRNYIRKYGDVHMNIAAWENEMYEAAMAL